MRRRFFYITLFMALSHIGLGQGCKPVVNLGGQVSFCLGNFVTLDAQNPSYSFQWSTGATTQTINVNSTSVIWVAVTNSCGTTYDTVYVYADQPVTPNLGMDRPICTGTNNTLSVANSPSMSYRWSTGSMNTNSINVTQAGTYWVEVTNACGVYSDTVVLSGETPISVNLGQDRFECGNQSVALNSGNHQGSRQWSTGASSTTIQVFQTGTYWVGVTNSCGTFYDTVNVFFSEANLLNLGDTARMCGGSAATLTAQPNYGTYLWNNGATTKTISVSNPGTYWVRFNDPCGNVYDTIHVVNSGPAQVNLGPDQAICPNKPIVLDAKNAGSIYQWSTGNVGRTIQVSQGGTYWVGVNNGCGFNYDTIDISLNPVPNASLLREKFFICANDSTPVDALDWGPASFYNWSTGATTQVAYMKTTGIHTVTFGNQCDTITHQFEVFLDQPLNLDIGPDSTLCDLFLTLRLNEMADTSQIRWSTGGKLDSTHATTSGTYWVEVTNACGVYTDSVDLIFLNNPAYLPQNHADLCSGQTLKITVPFDSTVTYLWDDFSNQHFRNITQPGIYWLTSYNRCDTITDSIEVELDFPINLDLGSDTTYCEPFVKVLNVSWHKADSIYWSTGSQNATLPVFNSGTYWVELYNACGMFTDTISITVDPLPKFYLKDTAMCIGNTATLDATQSIPGATYLWSTGATTSSIQVTQNGGYWVDITNGCGTVRDTAFVRVDQPIAKVDLGNDTIFCQGTLLLDAGTFSGAEYEWQSGSRSRTYLVTQSGQYYVKVQNLCNAAYDTINILITGPPQLVLGDEVRYCANTILNLNAQNPGCTYLWNTGDTTQFIQVPFPGTYWVTITNDCGQLTDTVEAIIEFPMDDMDLGPDTIMCAGQIKTLTTGYTGVDTEWQDGSTTETYAVTQTGTYWAKLTNTCGSYFDTVFIEVIEIPVFSLGDDTAICHVGSVVDLDGPPGMLSYQWSNGATIEDIVVFEAGTFWLTVTNECFSYTDTIELIEEYPIVVDLGPDTVVCQTTGGYLIQSGVTNYQVWWGGTTFGQDLLVNQTGSYWAEARNSCGRFSDTIFVKIDPVLQDETVDTLICEGDSLKIDLTNADFEYQWLDGFANPLRYIQGVGNFDLLRTNTCGSAIRTYTLTETNCDCPFFLASAFTPNDDGINDNYMPVFDCDVFEYSFKLYNRWGGLIMETTDPFFQWDGKAKGQRVQQGVYSYVATYKWLVYGEVYQKTVRNELMILH